MSYIRTFALLAAALGNCPSLRAQQADMVLIHGTVLTVDAKDTVAQALAIRRGGIVAVGTDAQIMKLAGKTTRIVDLHGRTATPGMIDTHSHYTEAGAEDLYFPSSVDNISPRSFSACLPARIEQVRARAAPRAPILQPTRPSVNSPTRRLPRRRGSAEMAGSSRL